MEALLQCPTAHSAKCMDCRHVSQQHYSLKHRGPVQHRAICFKFVGTLDPVYTRQLTAARLYFRQHLTHCAPNTKRKRRKTAGRTGSTAWLVGLMSVTSSQKVFHKIRGWVSYLLSKCFFHENVIQILRSSDILGLYFNF
jgi:hypothetical protein